MNHLLRATPAALLLAACAHAAARPTMASGPEPPFATARAVAPGPWIEPDERPLEGVPAPVLGPFVRVAIATGVYVFDAAGHVAALASNELRAVHYDEPVRTLAGDGAVLMSGGFEQVTLHTLLHYALDVPVIDGTGSTFLPRDPGPMVMYETRTHLRFPALRRAGAMDRQTDATVRALGRLMPSEMVAWYRAAGPLAASAVQIDGENPRFRYDPSAAAPLHVCAVRPDRTVACWGASPFAELGDGRIATTPRLVNVPGLADVVEVAVGEAHACARVRDGRVACWGDASWAQFPGVATSSVPVCAVDTVATARLLDQRRRQSRETAEGCMRTRCPPGTLDCHLGCVAVEYTPETVYDPSRPCVVPTGATGPARPRRVVAHPAWWPGLVDAVSIAATGITTCVVHATGVLECHGGDFRDVRTWTAADVRPPAR